ncbi:hypothetical protein IVA88_29740 [Bradyrhizobium sp. 149]|uniref:hypothetical protein n=1 Tax=Bradyrhizobium sp. 149 TaxID=2782624 RepID=UPI001FFA8607|nr:hypothetical protein [Bradyrhizobium sp. 149]MCK1655580.1 hypothetical protein [Bradyrhizobium sp. 149]
MTEQTAFLALLSMCLLLLVVLAIRRLGHLDRRLAKISEIDAKLSLLLSHSELKYDPFEQLPIAVANALRDGNKIEAIRQYRRAAGVDLKTSKAFVEQYVLIEQGFGVAFR